MDGKSLGILVICAIAFLGVVFVHAIDKVDKDQKATVETASEIAVRLSKGEVVSGKDYAFLVSSYQNTNLNRGLWKVLKGDGLSDTTIFSITNGETINVSWQIVRQREPTGN